MTTDALLQDRLRAFVAWAPLSEIGALQFDLAWPSELRSLAQRFEGYVWALAVSPGRLRAIGICRLDHRPPQELANLESLIFRPNRYDATIRRHVGDAHEYYLIADLIAAPIVQTYLSMLSPPDKWYLIEHHRMTLNAR